MTSTRLRATTLASLLLGASGLVGLAVPAAHAASEPRPHRSADALTRAVEGRVSAATAARVQRLLSSPATQRAVAAHRGGGVVVVRAHIIVGTRKRDKRRHATKRQVRQQVKWLNLAYSGGEAPGVAADTGVRFRLRSITTTKSRTWAHLRTQRQLNQMKKRLHRGNARTLNLYFTGLPSGLLGISTFPWDYRAHKALDGSVIAYGSIRGGSIAGFNEGDTAVHEVGHWLGLLHTFQGDAAHPDGCDPDPAGGDGVADTPAELSGQSTYFEGRDTCPGVGGLDPIHNFMDYPPDAVMNQFTPGQVGRIAQARAAYRAS